MKIRRLFIEKHNHLENLEMNFTYPEGHAKYGQPLEKICLIGQSATGKTSILQYIKENVTELRNFEVIDGAYFFTSRSLTNGGKVEYDYNGVRLIAGGNDLILGDSTFQGIEDGGGMMSKLLKKGVKLIYLGAELISREAVDIFNKNPVEIQETERSQHTLRNRSIGNYFDYICEFTQNIDGALWLSLLDKILVYRKRFTQMASELINKGFIGDFQRLNNEFTKWSESNENPLKPFATYFNPILSKLDLEVDLVNTEYFVPIKSKRREEVIPISSLSTGTKGLLLSLFPLFELDTKDAMILIDEPERSLFPDLQIELISHYRDISPQSQLIVATHSPFIAAAFEPEERFILYFNENGKVSVRQGVSPKGDDPNDILRNDFNVDYYNEFGKEAYQRYLNLKQTLIKETDSEVKKKLINEIAELGDKYNF